MKKLFSGCFLFLAFSSAGIAGDEQLLFERANQAYSKSNFREALTLYNNILKEGYESAELYFNMGNAYFKSDSLPQAILYYEKAKKLSPLDEDISANLKLANLRTIDKTEASAELFIVQWVKQFTRTKSSAEWSVQTIVSFFIAFSLLCFYMLAQTAGKKKLFFFSALLFFIITAFSFLLARAGYHMQTRSDTAVLFSASAQAKSAPNETSTNLFLIHAGVKFRIIEQNGEYSRIKLDNGNEGWIKTTSFRPV